MKVLFVTTNHFPHDGTCSNILSILLQQPEFHCDNVNVSVLGSKKTIDEMDCETWNNVNVYRAEVFTLFNRTDFIMALRKRPSILISALIGRLRLFITSRYVKTTYCDKHSYNQFLKIIRELDAQMEFDVIVSISGRYEATYAAIDYLAEAKRKIDFVFYQVDPLGTNLSFDMCTRLAREKKELQIHQVSKKVLTTSIILEEKRRDANYDSKLLKKIEKIEFPLIKPEVNESSSAESRLSKPVICVFLGTIYSNVRDPNYTFKLFKRVVDEAIEFHLVGVSEEDIPDEYKDPHIKCFGRRNIEECKAIMKNADALVNIGNNVLNQVPSKIFDYISTGKPIINICKSIYCPTIEYLSRYSEALTLYEDDAILEQQSKKLREYLLHEHKIVSEKDINEAFYDCTPGYCSKKLFEAIIKENSETIRYE